MIHAFFLRPNRLSLTGRGRSLVDALYDCGRHLDTNNPPADREALVRLSGEAVLDYPDDAPPTGVREIVTESGEYKLRIMQMKLP